MRRGGFVPPKGYYSYSGLRRHLLPNQTQSGESDGECYVRAGDSFNSPVSAYVYVIISC